MPRFKVLLTDYAWPELDIERGVLAAADAELIVAEAADADSLARLAGDVDAIMTNWANVPASVIEAAPNCRIVARLGIGLDNIDVACATRRRIPVTNVPDYCLIEVAEHALALILALGRKVGHYHLATKAGRYELQSGPPLRRIAGQTLGIVGLGATGARLAHRAIGIGLSVIATNRSGRSQVARVRICELDDLLRQSDYVSLHVPLTDQTRRLIGREALAKLKPTAYLINTSRGGVLDYTALAEALAAGRLAGAALDVQENEPPDLSQPPYNDPRVIVTPHAAFYSEESVADLRRRVAEQVVARLSGKIPENVVNPEVL
jgi:D-3-phosphoglycerate dehydrogenase